ncbi:MAG: fructose-bisphosphatase class III [Candidatus Roizmanbacteria bacterium]
MTEYKTTEAQIARIIHVDLTEQQKQASAHYSESATTQKWGDILATQDGRDALEKAKNIVADTQLALIIQKNTGESDHDHHVRIANEVRSCLMYSQAYAQDAPDNLVHKFLEGKGYLDHPERLIQALEGFMKLPDQTANPTGSTAQKPEANTNNVPLLTENIGRDLVDALEDNVNTLDPANKEYAALFALDLIADPMLDVEDPDTAGKTFRQLIADQIQIVKDANVITADKNKSKPDVDAATKRGEDAAKAILEIRQRFYEYAKIALVKKDELSKPPSTETSEQTKKRVASSEMWKKIAAIMPKSGGNDILPTFLDAHKGIDLRTEEERRKDKTKPSAERALAHIARGGFPIQDQDSFITSALKGIDLMQQGLSQQPEKSKTPDDIDIHELSFDQSSGIKVGPAKPAEAPDLTPTQEPLRPKETVKELVDTTIAFVSEDERAIKMNKKLGDHLSARGHDEPRIITLKEKLRHPIATIKDLWNRSAHIKNRNAAFATELSTIIKEESGIDPLTHVELTEEQIDNILAQAKRGRQATFESLRTRDKVSIWLRRKANIVANVVGVQTTDMELTKRWIEVNAAQIATGDIMRSSIDEQTGFALRFAKKVDATGLTPTQAKEVEGQFIRENLGEMRVSLSSIKADGRWTGDEQDVQQGIKEIIATYQGAIKNATPEQILVAEKELIAKTNTLYQEQILGGITDKDLKNKLNGISVANTILHTARKFAEVDPNTQKSRYDLMQEVTPGANDDKKVWDTHKFDIQLARGEWGGARTTEHAGLVDRYLYRRLSERTTDRMHRTTGQAVSAARGLRGVVGDLGYYAAFFGSGYAGVAVARAAGLGRKAVGLVGFGVGGVAGAAGYSALREGGLAWGSDYKGIKGIFRGRYLKEYEQVSYEHAQGRKANNTENRSPRRNELMSALVEGKDVLVISQEITGLRATYESAPTEDNKQKLILALGQARARISLTEASIKRDGGHVKVAMNWVKYHEGQENAEDFQLKATLADTLMQLAKDGVAVDKIKDAEALAKAAFAVGYKTATHTQHGQARAIGTTGQNTENLVLYLVKEEGKTEAEARAVLTGFQNTLLDGAMGGLTDVNSAEAKMRRLQKLNARAGRKAAASAAVSALVGGLISTEVVNWAQESIMPTLQDGLQAGDLATIASNTIRYNVGHFQANFGGGRLPVIEDAAGIPSLHLSPIEKALSFTRAAIKDPGALIYDHLRIDKNIQIPGGWQIGKDNDTWLNGLMKDQPPQFHTETVNGLQMKLPSWAEHGQTGTQDYIVDRSTGEIAGAWDKGLTLSQNANGDLISMDTSGNVVPLPAALKTFTLERGNLVGTTDRLMSSDIEKTLQSNIQDIQNGKLDSLKNSLSALGAKNVVVHQTPGVGGAIGTAKISFDDAHGVHQEVPVHVTVDGKDVVASSDPNALQIRVVAEAAKRGPDVTSPGTSTPEIKIGSPEDARKLYETLGKDIKSQYITNGTPQSDWQELQAHTNAVQLANGKWVAQLDSSRMGRALVDGKWINVQDEIVNKGKMQFIFRLPGAGKAIKVDDLGDGKTDGKFTLDPESTTRVLSDGQPITYQGHELTVGELSKIMVDEGKLNEAIDLAKKFGSPDKGGSIDIATEYFNNYKGASQMLQVWKTSPDGKSVGFIQTAFDKDNGTTGILATMRGTGSANVTIPGTNIPGVTTPGELIPARVTLNVDDLVTTRQDGLPTLIPHTEFNVDMYPFPILPWSPRLERSIKGESVRGPDGESASGKWVNQREVIKTKTYEQWLIATEEKIIQLEAEMAALEAKLATATGADKADIEAKIVGKKEEIQWAEEKVAREAKYQELRGIQQLYMGETSHLLTFISWLKNSENDTSEGAEENRKMASGMLHDSGFTEEQINELKNTLVLSADGSYTAASEQEFKQKIKSMSEKILEQGLIDATIDQAFAQARAATPGFDVYINSLPTEKQAAAVLEARKKLAEFPEMKVRIQHQEDEFVRFLVAEKVRNDEVVSPIYVEVLNVQKDNLTKDIKTLTDIPEANRTPDQKRELRRSEGELAEVMEVLDLVGKKERELLQEQQQEAIAHTENAANQPKKSRFSFIRNLLKGKKGRSAPADTSGSTSEADATVTTPETASPEFDEAFKAALMAATGYSENDSADPNTRDTLDALFDKIPKGSADQIKVALDKALKRVKDADDRIDTLSDDDKKKADRYIDALDLLIGKLRHMQSTASDQQTQTTETEAALASELFKKKDVAGGSAVNPPPVVVQRVDSADAKIEFSPAYSNPEKGKPIESAIVSAPRVRFIPDIHGGSDATKKAGKSPLTPFRANSKEGEILVSLGDVADRGPQSWEAAKELKEMVERGEAIHVLGNHDMFAIATLLPAVGGDVLRQQAAFANWIFNGGAVTILGATGIDIEAIIQSEAKTSGSEEIDILRGLASGKGTSALIEAFEHVRQNKGLLDWTEHMRKHGKMYTVANGGLAVHAGIPVNKNGSLLPVKVNGQDLSGLDYLDAIQNAVRSGDANTILHVGDGDASKMNNFMWVREPYQKVIANREAAHTMREALNVQVKTRGGQVEFLVHGHDRHQGGTGLPTAETDQEKIFFIDTSHFDGGEPAALMASLSSDGKKIEVEFVNPETLLKPKDKNGDLIRMKGEYDLADALLVPNRKPAPVAPPEAPPTSAEKKNSLPGAITKEAWAKGERPDGYRSYQKTQKEFMQKNTSIRSVTDILFPGGDKLSEFYELLDLEVKGSNDGLLPTEVQRMTELSAMLQKIIEDKLKELEAAEKNKALPVAITSEEWKNGKIPESYRSYLDSKRKLFSRPAFGNLRLGHLKTDGKAKDLIDLETKGENQGLSPTEVQQLTELSRMIQKVIEDKLKEYDERKAAWTNGKRPDGYQDLEPLYAKLRPLIPQNETYITILYPNTNSLLRGDYDKLLGLIDIGADGGLTADETKQIVELSTAIAWLIKKKIDELKAAKVPSPSTEPALAEAQAALKLELKTSNEAWKKGERPNGFIDLTIPLGLLREQQKIRKEKFNIDDSSPHLTNEYIQMWNQCLELVKKAMSTGLDGAETKQIVDLSVKVNQELMRQIDLLKNDTQAKLDEEQRRNTPRPAVASQQTSEAEAHLETSETLSSQFDAAFNAALEAASAYANDPAVDLVSLTAHLVSLKTIIDKMPADDSEKKRGEALDSVMTLSKVEQTEDVTIERYSAAYKLIIETLMNMEPTPTEPQGGTPIEAARKKQESPLLAGLRSRAQSISQRLAEGNARRVAEKKRKNANDAPVATAGDQQTTTEAQAAETQAAEAQAALGLELNASKEAWNRAERPDGFVDLTESFAKLRGLHLAGTNTWEYLGPEPQKKDKVIQYQDLCKKAQETGLSKSEEDEIVAISKELSRLADERAQELEDLIPPAPPPESEPALVDANLGLNVDSSQPTSEAQGTILTPEAPHPDFNVELAHAETVIEQFTKGTANLSDLEYAISSIPLGDPQIVSEKIEEYTKKKTQAEYRIESGENMADKPADYVMVIAKDKREAQALGMLIDRLTSIGSESSADAQVSMQSAIAEAVVSVASIEAPAQETDQNSEESKNVQEAIDSIKNAGDMQERVKAAMRLLWLRDPILKDALDSIRQAEALHVDITKDISKSDQTFQRAYDQMSEFISKHGESLGIIIAPLQNNFVNRFLDLYGPHPRTGRRNPDETENSRNFGVCRTLEQIQDRFDVLSKAGKLTEEEKNQFNALISFAHEHSGKALLVVDQLNRKDLCEELMHEFNYWMINAVPDLSKVLKPATDPNYTGNWKHNNDFKVKTKINTSNLLLDSAVLHSTSEVERIDLQPGMAIIYRHKKNESDDHWTFYAHKVVTEESIKTINKDEITSPSNVNVMAHAEKHPHIVVLGRSDDQIQQMIKDAELQGHVKVDDDPRENPNRQPKNSREAEVGFVQAVDMATIAIVKYATGDTPLENLIEAIKTVPQEHTVAKDLKLSDLNEKIVSEKKYLKQKLDARENVAVDMSARSIFAMQLMIDHLNGQNIDAQEFNLDKIIAENQPVAPTAAAEAAAPGWIAEKAVDAEKENPDFESKFDQVIDTVEEYGSTEKYKTLNAVMEVIDQRMPSGSVAQLRKANERANTLSDLHLARMNEAKSAGNDQMYFGESKRKAALFYLIRKLNSMIIAQTKQ